MVAVLAGMMPVPGIVPAALGAAAAGGSATGVNGGAGAIGADGVSGAVGLGSGLGAGRGRDSFRVARIYYYGYEGMDLAKVKAALPLKVGDRVTLGNGEWDRVEKRIRATVLKTTGKPPSGGVGVCCARDDGSGDGGVLVFVGLSGKSYRAEKWRAAPTGDAHLGRGGMHLYDEWVKAFTKAVEQGDSLEDDAKGYALAHDAAVRSIEMEMRAWAANREPELIDVLEHAKDARQRAAAAELLGYADRSRRQIQALTNAAEDENSEVRNNAVRALGVLAAAGRGVQIEVNLKPLVDLLYSGTWTDRNKASWLIANLTDGQRDTNMLGQLRKTAMAPLVEGAKWDAGHAGFFLTILGRIGGIPEKKLEGMIAAGDRGAIIAAAEAAKD